jgi:hypothetical protein
MKLIHYRPICLKENVFAVVSSIDHEGDLVAFNTDLGGLAVKVSRELFPDFRPGLLCSVDVIQLIEAGLYPYREHLVDLLPPIYEIVRVKKRNTIMYDNTKDLDLPPCD